MAKTKAKTITENGVEWTVGRDLNTADLSNILHWSKGTTLHSAYNRPSQTKLNIWTSWETYFNEVAKQRNRETASCMHTLVPQMYVISANCYTFTIGCRIGNTFYYVTSTRQERHLITDMV